MSDKYYLHDCNSYTHSCHNTYRIERKDVREMVLLSEQLLDAEKKQAKWWQRLWIRETQQATKT